ncbi:MAG: L-threonylcarbamoyladenylate synthase [Chloroflexota bacterium]
MSAPDLLPATPDGLRSAAALIRAGELVVFPTDTVHGLAVRRDDPGALERLFELKGRPKDRRVAWLVRDLEQARQLGLEIDARAAALAQRFWPGGLTLVLAGPDGTTLGVRAPDHATAQALLALTGPLPTSSANRHGEPETFGADDVLVAFAMADGLAAIVEGRSPGGRASSVLDLTVEPPRLLRDGAIPRKELENVIGPID